MKREKKASCLLATGAHGGPASRASPNLIWRRSNRRPCAIRHSVSRNVMASPELRLSIGRTGLMKPQRLQGGWQRPPSSLLSWRPLTWHAWPAVRAARSLSRAGHSRVWTLGGPLLAPSRASEPRSAMGVDSQTRGDTPSGSLLRQASQDEGGEGVPAHTHHLLAALQGTAVAPCGRRANQPLRLVPDPSPLRAIR